MSIESRGRPEGPDDVPPAGWQVERCQRCGAQFDCGAALPPATPCWCMALPPLPAPRASTDAGLPSRCLCPACLASATGGSTESR